MPSIITHARPDGDALGSAMALHMLSGGQDDWHHPISDIPQHLLWILDYAGLTPTDHAPAQDDELIIVDTFSVAKTPYPDLTNQSIRYIDHHESEARTTRKHDHIDPSAASTTLIIAEQIQDGHISVDHLTEETKQKVMTLLLTGLITDTDNLQHSNADERARNIYDWLVSQGAQKDFILEKLAPTAEEKNLIEKYTAHISRFESGRSTLIVPEQVPPRVKDELLKYMLQGSDPIMIIRATEDGNTIINLRSNKYDTLEIAQALGAPADLGGHREATGFTASNMHFIDGKLDSTTILDTFLDLSL